MKTIVIGDIHGREIWKQISTQDFDEFVFIGDYFDSFDVHPEKQLQNFLDIIAFKDAYPDKVKLLIGNHDYHYLEIGETYAGFNKVYQYHFTPVLKANLHKMQVCHSIIRENNSINPIIYCTHAGISTTFLKGNGITDNIEQSLNDLFKYRPLAFRFYGNNDTGDDITQGPLWIRPDSLSEDGIDQMQIVGHTVVNFIGSPKGNRAPFYLIDVLSKSREYLVITPEAIEIKIT